ncbi:MAG: hypothetical protein H7A51_15990 [Akkermansiaceae bacterium]|nr:hypothetical protein [Akkermansiaceae bacterium]
MSKKNRRFGTVQGDAKKQPQDTKPSPAMLTLWEKFQIFGAVCVILVAMVGTCVRTSAIRHKEEIQQRVGRLKWEHALTDSQVAELLEIELDFHRYERPFSMESNPTRKELDEHLLAIKKRFGDIDSCH